MCGIFGLLNNNNYHSDDVVNNSFHRGQPRGPEYSCIRNININTTLGFHRLAINGLNEHSNQPLEIEDVTLVCNGEIYNYKELYRQIGVTPNTDSDCEVIIHMYKKFGIEYTLNQLDGVFAFALLDNEKLFLARDPYGVRPLFTLSLKTDRYLDIEGFASTMVSLVDLSARNSESVIEPFKPGTYREYKRLCNNENECWKVMLQETYTYPGLLTGVQIQDEEEAIKKVHDSLSNAVKKRVENTDRPVACLLSGGLDSSLITALVKRFYGGQLETYSIGLPGSEDLKYAKQVANFLGTKHTEIELSEEDFFNAIPDVIYNIESYDTTTVRASVGNFLIGQYIAKNSEAKVIFNGDGSDELSGGYMYFHCAPDAQCFDAECKRLLKNIYFFDVLRSDRSISSHGLEPRTPFLDRGFVQDYLSISKMLRFHPSNNKCEKYLIRKAFDNKENPYLPDEILWRQKEAFSDGVSSQTRSWYTIIDERIKKNFGESYDTIPESLSYVNFNLPKTRE